MSSTTRRSILKMAGASAAALSIGTRALHASQMPGRPSAEATESRVNKSSNVMAIAAHPGDAFFAMGAPVAMAAQSGAKGFLLSLTLGEKGSLTIPPAQYGVFQREAAEKAASLMNAEALFLGYADGELPANDEAKYAVCDLIRQYKPTTVVTHWKRSWHKDHRACYDIVQDAVFYAGLASIIRKLPAHEVKEILFNDNWEDADGFVSDTYLDITPVCDRWLQACSSFPMWRGENGFRYNDYYASRAVTCGCISNFKQAVAFMSPADQRVRHTRSL
jgi:LmbE family N-acetylglucosaminyl deacetylase